MAIQTRTTLKSWFETGDKPTQDQFADWIDSYWHLTEDASILDDYVTNSSLATTLSTYLQDSDVIDNLLSSDGTVPLSANQGRVLKGLIDGISGTSTWGAIAGTLSDQTDLQSELDDKQDSLTSLRGLTLTGSSQLNLGGNYDGGNIALTSSTGNRFYINIDDGVDRDEEFFFGYEGQTYQYGYRYQNTGLDSSFYYSKATNRFTRQLGISPTVYGYIYEDVNGVTYGSASNSSYFGSKYDADYSSQWGTAGSLNRYIPDIGWVYDYVQASLGTSTFISLTDTPGSYTADKWLKVNAGGTALEFTDAPASSGVWGSITGTLSNQTDLQGELDLKDDILTFDNGLTRTSDTITLGDTSFTSGINLISLNESFLDVQIGSGATYYNFLTMLGSSVSIGTNTSGADLHQTIYDRTNGRIDITSLTATNDARLRFEDGDIIIRDSGSSPLVKGLKYVRDSESQWGTIDSSNLYVPHVGWVVDYVAASGGASTLASLTDTTISSPASGQYLNYSGSAWINKQIAYSELSGTPTIPTTLSSLSDVTITSAATGEYLGWNGSEWVDKQIAYSEVSGTPSLATVATTGDYDDLINTPNLALVATTGDYNDLLNLPTIYSTIAGLTDTNITSPASNNYLGWNGTAWIDRQISYSEVFGTPVLATVATTGDYDDLNNIAYSDGSWTPTGNNITYSVTTQSTYMRVDDMVYLSFAFYVPTNTDSVNDFEISGFPYASGTGLIQYGFIGRRLNINYPNYNTYFAEMVISGGHRIIPISNLATGNLKNSDMSGYSIFGTFTYRGA
jgi:hypothetical protein